MLGIEYYIQVVVTLCLFIGMLFILLVLVKKFNKKTTKGDLQILDRIQLSSSTSISIVKVKEKTLLLGIGKDVRLLDEL